jgi:putative transcriptional regulator
LVAEPELRDPNFDHTVVYVLDHDGTGAMGLVINRVLAEGPLDRLLESVLEDAPPIDPDQTIRIYYGGPVQPEQPIVLHSREYHLPSTVDVEDGIAFTPSIDVLRDLARGQGPRQSLLAIGYAGWSPGQLEREISQGAWLVVDSDATLVFDAGVASKWERAFARRGVDL